MGDDRRRRRYRLLVLVATLAVVVILFWWRPRLESLFGGPLEQQSARAGVTSMYLAAAGLLVSIAALAVAYLQLRQRPTPAGLPAPLPETGEPGMTSLAPPLDLLTAHLRGRGALVRQIAGIHRARRGIRVRVLHGMGGAGKTSVALAVARAVESRGVHVWWLSAADQTVLKLGMRQLAARLGASDVEIARAWSALDSATDLVWRRLNAFGERWLLVLDNADDVRVLTAPGEPVMSGRGWVRRAGRRGAILITTRDGAASTWRADWCGLHRVDMLSPDDGAQVLLDYTGPEAGSRVEAAALSERLGGLPLALGLAGRYIAQARRFPVPSAITTFRSYRAAVGSGRDTPARLVLTGDQARRLIDRTWALSLELLADRGDRHARELLRLLSLLASDPIPFALLDPTVISGVAPFRGLGAADLQQTLSALADLNLVEPAADGGGLRIHPLIRDAGAADLEASDHLAEYRRLVVALVVHAAPSPPDDPSTWARWRPLAVHALEAVSVALADGEPALVTAAAEVGCLAARYLAAFGLFAPALNAGAMVLDAYRRVLPENDPKVLNMRADIAWWMGESGDLAGGRDAYAELVPQFDRVVGGDHPDTLRAKIRLAWWTGAAGNAAAARDMYAAMLPIRVRVSGPEHPDTLTLRAHLARWIGEAGDAARARAEFADLVPARRRVSGEDYPDTLIARANVARWTGFAGDPVRARDLYRELLPDYLRVFGELHPDTLILRADVANWTGESGDAAAARDLLTALVPVRERVSGTEHPETLLVRAKAAHWTGVAGDPAAARDQLSALLPRMAAVLGGEHPDVLSARADLAGWVGASGDSGAARAQLAALLPIRERVSGADHPASRALRDRLAGQPK